MTISSSGLNPSNRNAGFRNLAAGQNPSPEVIAEVTAIAEAELRAAGIDVHIIRFFPGARGEVPSNARGTLSMWGFERFWYYWVAKGPGLPVEVAERLHATHGREVRVDGHCGCPSPREWYKGFGVGHYHVDGPDGLKALADAIRSVVGAPVAERPQATEAKLDGGVVNVCEGCLWHEQPESFARKCPICGSGKESTNTPPNPLADKSGNSTSS